MAGKTTGNFPTCGLPWLDPKRIQHTQGEVWTGNLRHSQDEPKHKDTGGAEEHYVFSHLEYGRFALDSEITKIPDTPRIDSDQSVEVVLTVEEDKFKLNRSYG